ncbi:MAG: SRPBCC family protein [Alphaproteobacteria bacterium]|jgi:hypothetical protein|nr:SRPBCC family protein [Alphaproteobacteria bacterium]
MKLTYSITIKADINTVFSYLEDNKKKASWLFNVLEINNLPKEKFENGTPFVMKVKESFGTKDYKGYTRINEKPNYQHISMKIDPKIELENYYFLKEVETNKTQLNYIAVYKLQGFKLKATMLFNYPFFYAPFIKSSVISQLKKLKKLAESDKD